MFRIRRVAAACAAILGFASTAQAQAPYPCEAGLIEVMFAQESRVRLRAGELRDLAGPALSGLDAALSGIAEREWSPLCGVPEETLDRLAAQGEARTGKPVYNLNNLYHLRIEGGDVWEVSRRLEELPGIASARPVPLPIEPPMPPDYALDQEYAAPSGWAPSGTHNEILRLYPGGDGAGITVCDLEYAWNYNHADISRAAGSQINPTTATPPGFDDHHGTAVIGMLSADDNGWGIKGLCRGAGLMTCGTYYGSPTPSWNVAGAIALAIVNLSPGDVILLEQQWDYNDPNTPGPDYVPIEWWLNTWPNGQTSNAVYVAILNAIANGIHVVEAGGNGGVDTDNLAWFADSHAVIVGAGGAYAGGALGGQNLERLSFSSFGSRFNVQGWGENVVTTGYGDLYSAMGHNYRYTQTFSGTSSASAHVAAALACYSGSSKGLYGLPPDPLPARSNLATYGKPQFFGLAGVIGPRPDLLRLAMTYISAPLSNGGDYGDAPEGVLAYPNMFPPVVGFFPTTWHDGPPNTFMFHPRPLGPARIHLGSAADYEYEGNGGLLFGTFFDYDADEGALTVVRSSDHGLLRPKIYTIDGGAVVEAGPNPVNDLGPACGYAVWGSDIDLSVVNTTPFNVYLNVIADWNMDGQWGGYAWCAGGALVEEHCLKNFVVPPTGIFPVALSSLPSPPPPIALGPTMGYTGFTWVRFTLTDLPIPAGNAWQGDLATGWSAWVQGETEDYLLLVDPAATGVETAAAVERPAVLAARPNPFQEETALRLRLPADTRVSARVYDARGRLVRTIAEGPMAAGEHEVRWNGETDNAERAAAGVYFCRVRMGEREEMLKISLAR